MCSSLGWFKTFPNTLNRYKMRCRVVNRHARVHIAITYEEKKTSMLTTIDRLQTRSHTLFDLCVCFCIFSFFYISSIHITTETDNTKHIHTHTECLIRLIRVVVCESVETLIEGLHTDLVRTPTPAMKVNLKDCVFALCVHTY